jgi:hypothetical protein
LPPEERPLQRRYTLVDRFNVFLPPTGRIVLEGPEPSRLPSQLDGMHQILLRVEVSDDKEGNSSLDLAGAGSGVVHAGAVAGFPMPVLRYFVGSAGDLPEAAIDADLALMAPLEGAVLAGDDPLTFAWEQARAQLRGAVAYRLQVENAAGESLLQAIVQQGIGLYRAPDWLARNAAGQQLRWRVVAIGPQGKEAGATGWRSLSIAP